MKTLRRGPMRAGPKRAPVRTALPARKALATKADEVVRFFHTRLTHVKGELAGRPLKLAQWQIKDIIEPLFNRQHADGRRQIRTCYVELPRKNAKSTLAAGLALYLLYEDNEPGAEIVSAASDRNQAAIVFEIARGMVEANPILASMTQIYRRELVIPATDERPWESRYHVISSEAYSKHGMNLHAAIIDEVHAHQDGGELWSVLTKAMGSRRQPLTFAITTAGFDRTEASLCWTLHEHARRVNAGLIEDPSFHGLIYGAELEADWKDPAIWAQANPGLGSTIKREYLEQECRRAQDMPAYEHEFRRYHLNQWTQSSVAWIPMDMWDKGATPVDPEALRGKVCYAGLDLSTTTDLTALVLVFPDQDGGYDVLPFVWCPADGMRQRSQRDHAPYEHWARSGQVIVTDGSVVDYEAIRMELSALAVRYHIAEIAYDRWNATQLVTQLQQDGANVAPLGQGYQSLSAPSKEFEKLVRAGALRHGGHGPLRWCVANTVLETDSAKNIKPSKKKSTERIDLTVALIMAIERAMRGGNRPSVYEQRGVVAF